MYNKSLAVDCEMTVTVKYTTELGAEASQNVENEYCVDTNNNALVGTFIVNDPADNEYFDFIFEFILNGPYEYIDDGEIDFNTVKMSFFRSKPSKHFERRCKFEFDMDDDLKIAYFADKGIDLIKTLNDRNTDKISIELCNAMKENIANFIHASGEKLKSLNVKLDIVNYHIIETTTIGG